MSSRCFLVRAGGCLYAQFASSEEEALTRVGDTDGNHGEVLGELNVGFRCDTLSLSEWLVLRGDV